MDLDDHPTDAAAVAQLARLAEENLPANLVTTPDGRTFALHRSDISLKDITPPNKAEVYAPKIISLTTQLQTAGALMQYLNRFKDDESIMFADALGNKITAILDYHVRPTANIPGITVREVEEAKPDVEAIPRHSAHRAVLTLRHTVEWEAWTGQMRKGLVSHTDFINFLEENSFDIVDPNPVTMVENCRDMRGVEAGDFTSSVRAGAVQTFSYRQDNKVSSSEFPMEFTVNIPIYLGEAPTSFKVMTRYLYKSGELKLGIKILRLERERLDAFMAIAKGISTGTGIEAVLGNPA